MRDHSDSGFQPPASRPTPPSAAGLALTPVPSQRALVGRRMRAPEADAALLDLGRQFEAAWATERALAQRSAQSKEEWERLDAELDAAALECKALAHRIIDLPALSLEGFLIKIRVASWCHSGEPIDTEWLKDAGWRDYWNVAGEPQTSDTMVVLSILRDLAALSVPPTPSRAAAKAA